MPNYLTATGAVVVDASIHWLQSEPSGRCAGDQSVKASPVMIDLDDVPGMDAFESHELKSCACCGVLCAMAGWRGRPKDPSAGGIHRRSKPALGAKGLQFVEWPDFLVPFSLRGDLGSTGLANSQIVSAAAAGPE